MYLGLTCQDISSIYPNICLMSPSRGTRYIHMSETHLCNIRYMSQTDLVPRLQKAPRGHVSWRHMQISKIGEESQRRASVLLFCSPVLLENGLTHNAGASCNNVPPACIEKSCLQHVRQLGVRSCSWPDATGISYKSSCDCKIDNSLWHYSFAIW